MAVSGSKNIIKNMIVLATGAVAAKAVGILVIPIVTRLYTPEDMGNLAVFSAIVLISAPVLNLRLSVAIPLPRSPRRANQLFTLGVVSSLFLSFLFLVFLFLFKAYLADLFNIDALNNFWWLIVLSSFLFSITDTTICFLTREKAFRVVAKIQLYQAALGASLKVLLGVASLPLGLVIGHACQYGIGFWKIALGEVLLFRKRDGIRSLITVAKKYSDFPKYRVPSQFLTVFSMQAPVMVFSALYGIEATGQLSLAVMMMALPITLIGTTTAQAYYGEVAKLGVRRSEEIYKISSDIVKKLVVFSLLPFFAIFLFGEKLFLVVFGEGWGEAGKYASIMSFYLIPQFVSSPLTSVMNLYSRQGLNFILNLFRVALIGVVCLISIFFEFGGMQFVVSYSCVMFFYYFVYFLIVFKVIRSGQDKVEMACE